MSLPEHKQGDTELTLSFWSLFMVSSQVRNKLEHLECLRSENIPRCPMITHTIDSYQIPVIPSHNKTKLSYKFKKFPKIQILKFCQNLNTQHTFLKLFDMMYIQRVLWKTQKAHDSE